MDTRAYRTRTQLLLVLLFVQAVATASSLSHRPPAGAPPRLAIDLAHDPPWRLRLVPGIGPARARRIVEERALPVADPRGLLERALGVRLAERIAAAPLVEFVRER